MNNVIGKCSFHVHRDETAEGYFVLTCYVDSALGACISTGCYRHLTYTELVDVVLAILDENRPGNSEQDGVSFRQLF